MKTSWTRALFIFFSPLIFYGLVRWLVLETFIIPSGSMVPTLLINETILVNKGAFGIRNPFKNDFLIRWGEPNRGDIVVFRYPKNPEVFYVKRLIGLPNDDISLNGNELTVNGEKSKLSPATRPFKKTADDDHTYYTENGHYVRYHQYEGSDAHVHVPEHEYFVLGDNRDESADSRFWGFVPEQNLVGRVKLVLFSTELSFFQDPAALVFRSIRWRRLFRAP